MKRIVRGIVSSVFVAGLAFASIGSAQPQQEPSEPSVADLRAREPPPAPPGLAAIRGASPAPAGAGARWTTPDVLLEVTYAALVLVDWGQANTVADDPRYYEKNPVLGRKPSRLATALYFPSLAVSHAVVSLLLPPTWRRVWQCVTIGYEGGAVIGNAQAGIQLRF